MKIKNENGREGFTIIELLIVVAIIGILATLMLLSYSHTLKKSRDAKRVSDIESVKLACNMYADKTGGYPKAYAWASLNSLLEDYIDVANIKDPKTFNYQYIYNESVGCKMSYYSEVEEDYKRVYCKD